jgi:hypothetical protein
VVRNERVETRDELLAAAASIGYPLVLKTAQANLDHKSDCDGVFVGICDEATLLAHYDDLDSRLGPAALLAPMVAEGIEVALGTVNDPQFGPIIMVTAGGILVELMDDRGIALCPVNEAQAEAMIASKSVGCSTACAVSPPPIDRRWLVRSCRCLKSPSSCATALPKSTSIL